MMSENGFFSILAVMYSVMYCRRSHFVLALCNKTSAGFIETGFDNHFFNYILQCVDSTLSFHVNKHESYSFLQEVPSPITKSLFLTCPVIYKEPSKANETSIAEWNNICLSRSVVFSYNGQDASQFGIYDKEYIWYRLKTTVTLVLKLQWKSLVILYDNSTDYVLDYIASTLEQQQVVLMKYNIDIIGTFNRSIYQTLHQIYTELQGGQNMNIVVLSNPFCAWDLLNQANKFDFVEENYGKTALYMESKWLIVPVCDLQWNVIWNGLEKLLNIAILRIDKSVINSNSYKTDQSAYDIETLMVTPSGRGFSSRNVSCCQNTQQQVFPNIDFGFNGRKLLVTTIVYFPFVERRLVNGKIRYYGYCMDLLEELSNILNFTYDVVETPDNEFGALLPNGSWTGIVGLLQRRRVDLAVAPLTIEARRETAIDFTSPYYFDSMTFLMKRPEESNEKWRLLIGPFHWIVHICVLLSLPVCSFIVYVFEKFTAMKKSRDWMHLTMYLFGALISQGGGHPPFSRSGKIFVTSWWVFSIVLTTTYCGNLVAFLTVVKEKAPINTFEELVSQSNYKWGTIGGSIYETLFQNSSNPTFKRIWNGIERYHQSDPTVLHKNQDVHIRKVLDENYAYLFEKTNFEILVRKDCRYTIAEEEYPTIQYGVGLPNNSPLTNLFSEKISQLVEGGFHYQWVDRHWPHVAHCKEFQRTEANTITLIDIQSSFYLIAVGIIISVIVLILEHLTIKCMT